MSFATTDSNTYWQNVVETPVPKGNCQTTPNSPFSDAPDGPFVEKGGVAEVIRKGNNPPTTNTTPTWAVNRTVYTLAGLSGSTLTAFNTTSTGLPQNIVNYVLGQDVNDENNNGNFTETRPSLHGDAIHSQPLPVDYGGPTGVVVYYGSNDGNRRRDVVIHRTGILHCRAARHAAHRLFAAFEQYPVDSLSEHAQRYYTRACGEELLLRWIDRPLSSCLQFKRVDISIHASRRQDDLCIRCNHAVVTGFQVEGWVSQPYQRYGVHLGNEWYRANLVGARGGGEHSRLHRAGDRRRRRLRFV
jgi:hypothetical protein